MTTGVLTVKVAHVEVTVPHGLVTTTWYAVPDMAAVTAFTVKVDDVAPAMFVNGPAQLVADCHWYEIPVAAAVTVKVAFEPAHKVVLAGC